MDTRMEEKTFKLSDLRLFKRSETKEMGLVCWESIEYCKKCEKGSYDYRLGFPL